MFKKIEKPTDILKHPFQKLLGWLGSVLYLFFISFREKRDLPKHPKSILVVRRNRLGDAVITALVLREIRLANPSIAITVVTNSYCLPIYEKIDSDFELVSIPDKYFGSSLGLRFHPAIRKMRQRNFDIAINASASYSSKAIYLLNCFNSHYKIAVGHPRARKFWELFLDNADPFDGNLNQRHQVWKICSVLKRSGLKFSPPAFAIPKTNDVRKILLCPEVNRLRSRWSVSNWIDLFNTLKKHGFDVSFCASPKYPEHFENLIRPKSVTELMNVIQDFDLIICQEGGTSHLAAVFNKQLITLSGVSIKNTWFPWSVAGHLLEATDNIESVRVADVVSLALEGGTSNCIDQNIFNEIDEYLSH